MQLRLTAKDKANGSDTGMGKDRARSNNNKKKKLPVWPGTSLALTTIRFVYPLLRPRLHTTTCNPSIALFGLCKTHRRTFFVGYVLLAKSQVLAAT